MLKKGKKESDPVNRKSTTERGRLRWLRPFLYIDLFRIRNTQEVRVATERANWGESVLAWLEWGRVNERIRQWNFVSLHSRCTLLPVMVTHHPNYLLTTCEGFRLLARSWKQKDQWNPASPIYPCSGRKRTIRYHCCTKTVEDLWKSTSCHLQKKTEEMRAEREDTGQEPPMN